MLKFVALLALLTSSAWADTPTSPNAKVWNGAGTHPITDHVVGGSDGLDVYNINPLSAPVSTQLVSGGSLITATPLSGHLAVDVNAIGITSTSTSVADITNNGTITGFCTTPNATCPAGSFVPLVITGVASAQIQISGTFTGAALNVDGAVNGTDWNTLLTASGSAGAYSTASFSSTGKYRIFRIAGLTQLRVRASALTSGSVTALLNASIGSNLTEVVQQTPSSLLTTSWLDDGSGNPISSTGGSLNANITNTVPITIASLPLPSNASQETGGHLAAIDTNTGNTATNTSTIAGNQTNGTQKAQRVDGSGNVSPAGDTNAHGDFVKPGDGTNTQGYTASNEAKVLVTPLTSSSTVTVVQPTGSNLNAAVSGTVTANAGTNLNTSALALESGGHLAAIDTNTSNSATRLTTINTTLGTPMQNSGGSVTANAGTNLNTSALALNATLTGGTQQTEINNGGTIAAVKAASTASGAADPALVVSVSPNNTPVLPSNASTATNQATANGSLATIATNLPPQGQALAAGSTPVVLPAAQITTLTPPTTVTVTQATAANLNGTVVTTGGVTIAKDSSLTTINTTLGTPMQNTGGSVTANAGTNLNTSALALNATLTGGTQQTEINNGGTVSAVKAASIAAVAADPALVVAISPNNTPVLPSGAATAAGLTTINTTLGTPMQNSGGSVTANAGTNLNTSALALSANQTNGTQQTKITDGTNISAVKAASTAAAAADPAQVVALSPNSPTPLTPGRTASGNITAACASGSGCAAGSTIQISTIGAGSVGFATSGTWVATMTTDVSYDPTCTSSPGTALWYSQGSIDTDNGTQNYQTTWTVALNNDPWIIATAGTQCARLRATAYTSGTVVVQMNADQPNGFQYTVPFGNVANGSTDIGNPIKVGGVYTTSVPTLLTGQRGDLRIDVNGNTQIVGNIADATADSGNPVKVGGLYESTQVAVTNGQRSHMAVSAFGDVSTADNTKYAHINTNTTTTVKSGSGLLYRVCTNIQVAAATATIFDNTAGSGTVIGVNTAGSNATGFTPQCENFGGVQFNTGLTIVTAGGPADYTVTYK